MNIIKNFLILLFSICLLYSPLNAAGSSGSDSGSTGSIAKKFTSYESAVRKIKKAKKLEKKGKTKKADKLYKSALMYLNKANKEKQLDPDTLNYLGFTNRKLGNFEDAEIYYLLGLDQDPSHNGINEYLGELYVQTNRIDKAKERLAVLENCQCKEYGELKGVIEGTKKSKY